MSFGYVRLICCKATDFRSVFLATINFLYLNNSTLKVRLLENLPQDNVEIFCN